MKHFWTKYADTLFSIFFSFIAVALIALVGMNWCVWATEDPSAVIRNVSIAIAAIFGVWFAVLRNRALAKQAAAALRQAATSEQGQITDRFAKAVELLGAESVTARVGGVYALKRIAEDSPARDHLVVMDVLTAFVRDWSRFIKGDPTDNPEIVAIMSSIRRRTPEQWNIEDGPPIYVFDLSRTKLGGLDLRKARLKYALLDEADLSNCNMRKAVLVSAKLRNTNLKGAYLGAAILTDADMENADLTGADISGAQMSQCQNLTQAQVNSAKFKSGYPPNLPDGLSLPC